MQPRRIRFPSQRVRHWHATNIRQRAHARSHTHHTHQNNTCCLESERIAKALHHPWNHILVNDPTRRVADNVTHERPRALLYYLRGGGGNGLALEAACACARTSAQWFAYVCMYVRIKTRDWNLGPGTGASSALGRIYKNITSQPSLCTRAFDPRFRSAGDISTAKLSSRANRNVHSLRELWMPLTNCCSGM